MPKKFVCNYTKEQLENLYIEEKRTLKEMCEIVGCKSTITMSKILRQHGIDTNKNHRISFEKRGNRTWRELQFFLIDEYYHNHRSMSSIAKELGISNVIVKKYLKKLGYPIRTKSEQQAGEGAPNWSGGVHVKKDGYIEIYCPAHPKANKRKCVYQHQLIAEKKLVRYLRKGEVVHHIDSNKSNNDPDNLVVLTNSNHSKLHRLISQGNPFDLAVQSVEVINE